LVSNQLATSCVDLSLSAYYPVDGAAQSHSYLSQDRYN